MNPTNQRARAQLMHDYNEIAIELQKEKGYLDEKDEKELKRRFAARLKKRAKEATRERSKRERLSEPCIYMASDITDKRIKVIKRQVRIVLRGLKFVWSRLSNKRPKTL